MGTLYSIFISFKFGKYITENDAYTYKIHLIEKHYVTSHGTIVQLLLYKGHDKRMTINTKYSQ